MCRLCEPLGSARTVVPFSPLGSMDNAPVETEGTSRNRITVTVLGIAISIAATFGVVQGPDGCKPSARVDVTVDGPGSGDMSFELINTEGEGSAEGTTEEAPAEEAPAEEGSGEAPEEPVEEGSGDSEEAGEGASEGDDAQASE